MADSPDLTARSAREIADLVRRGETSAAEVVEAHLLAIGADTTNAVVHVDAERVLADARAVDDAVASGRAGLVLAGVPVLVKDNIDVSGQVTAAGSRAHDGRPATQDAPVCRRLREAGAVVVGRANMDELAMGASTQTSAFGPTLNPFDRRRSPGGSSGGCAAAVAGGLVPLSVGTDTGGSIREPASQCGVVGLAPSPGLVPLDGVVPFAPRLDRVGPLARSADDARLLLDVLAGRRERPRRPLRRVAVVTELCGERNHAEVLTAFAAWLDQLVAGGVKVTETSLPDAPGALGAYMTLTAVAALDWLEPWLATGRAGEEVARRHELGSDLVAHHAGRIEEATDICRRLREECAAALADVDALVSPTMPTAAPLLYGEITPEELADPLADPYTDCWTVVANLADLPAVSVPAPVPEGRAPIGAMLIGSAGSDTDLLAGGALSHGDDVFPR